MEACAEIADFVADPVGRCIAGNTWLYFCLPRFCGFVLWGQPTETDVERLVRVLRVEIGMPAHVSLVDARRVTGAEPRTFAVLTEYVRGNHAALGRAVERLALVRPSGIVGAITSGFFGVTPPPYPVAIFEDRARAVAWLDVADADGTLAALARAEAKAAGEPLLRDLRSLLELRLDRATLSVAAKALGLSERSLQRRLGDHGTTFQAEVNRARVRIAKRMLRETDAKLTVVAHDVGCASLASFSGLFRRATGEAPSAWRDRHRK